MNRRNIRHASQGIPLNLVDAETQEKVLMIGTLQLVLARADMNSYPSSPALFSSPSRPVYGELFDLIVSGIDARHVAIVSRKILSSTVVSSCA